jgi:hypothetical protein
MNQTIRRLQKMEQNFNQGVDSEDSRLYFKKRHCACTQREKKVLTDPTTSYFG